MLRDEYNSTNLRRTRAACTRDNYKRIWPSKAGVDRRARDDKMAPVTLDERFRR
jgi:hypothetical protein